MVAIRSSEYSYAHIVNTLRAVRRYMAFIGVDMKIGMPRKPKPRIKTTLTEAEVAVIIAASKNIREKAIISLLAYSGIRNEELCNLCLRDIKLGRNMIHIRNGKGSKDRVIPVHGECIKIILQYLAKHPREDDDRLFLTHDKKRKLKPWALRLMVKTVAKRAGIKRRIYPHLFRHSMATSMLHRGANPLTIQAQLGHSFIETTMIYVHSSQERLRAEYLTCAPSYT